MAKLKEGSTVGGREIATKDTDEIVIGSNASAEGRFDIALGGNALSQGDTTYIYPAIAIGYEARATGNSSIALGQGASVTEGSSIALGPNVTSEGQYSVALGINASTNNDNEGVLGGVGSYNTNSWKVPGSFSVSGSKNFEIPHPKPEKKDTHVIRHGAVESPTAGDTLYRYTVQSTKEKDMQTIDLPDYFIYLNKDVQIFVSPQGHFGTGYGELNRETEQLEIHCQYEGVYNVLVIGTRNDDHQSVQDWDIKGVEREIGESWTGETYVFEDDEIIAEGEYLEEEIA